MKVFYHSADLDGICSAAIIYYYNQGKPCEYIGINYGDEFPWDIIKPLPSGKNEVVYMVDFSLPIEDMIKLSSMCDLIWIDHHITAIKAAKDANFKPFDSLIDNDMSGCELTWQYMFSDELPEAVYLLGRYDIWQYDDIPECKPFELGMLSYNLKYNSKIWEKLFREDDDYVGDIVKEGEIIQRYVDNQNIKMCKNCFEIDFEGYRAICLNGGKGSPTFDSVYNPEKHDLMLSFFLTKDLKWSISLYSTHDNVHCGEIAKKFGGGGHKGAAGFETKNLKVLGLWK